MLAQGVSDDAVAGDGVEAMSDLDIPDTPDDCGNDYEYWWKTVGQFQEDEAREAERDEANAMLKLIFGEDK